MKLPDLILHNWRLKLFSLLIAILIWEAIHLGIPNQGGEPGASPRTHSNPTNF